MTACVPISCSVFGALISIPPRLVAVDLHALPVLEGVDRPFGILPYAFRFPFYHPDSQACLPYPDPVIIQSVSVLCLGFPVFPYVKVTWAYRVMVEWCSW